MEIAVTHISKYSASQACLAGIDLSTGDFVRVKDRWGGFPERGDLTVDGRHLTFGDIIGFRTTDCGVAPPHCENVGFVGNIHLLESGVNWPAIVEESGCVSESIAVGFGCTPEQSAPAKSCMFESPTRSLCIVQAESVTSIFVDNWGKPRIRWGTDGLTITSGLDDIRVFPTNAGHDPDVVSSMDNQTKCARRTLIACSVAEFWNGGYWLLVAGVHPLRR